MTETDNVVSDRDIQATNVLPAYEASLAFGATEAELAQATGWRRAQLERHDAKVSGLSTYRHMAWMAGKPRYAEFVLDAAQRHTLSSLGVVGLACKSAATVGEALALHGRYQALTNRTAVYHSFVEGESLVLEEEREATCLGSHLISEYTMFVALHLLRLAAATAPRVVSMSTRRADLPADQERLFSTFLGAGVVQGAARARLVLEASVLEAPVRSFDPELATYFQSVLERAMPHKPAMPELVRDVSEAIRARLLHGTPTAGTVARALGFGQRTLQRRLSEHGWTFAALLDDTRKSLVEGHLRDPRLSLTEIAYLLGYSEQASFFRAFRRWFGTSPAKHRATLQ